MNTAFHIDFLIISIFNMAIFIRGTGQFCGVSFNRVVQLSLRYTENGSDYLEEEGDCRRGRLSIRMKIEPSFHILLLSYSISA